MIPRPRSAPRSWLSRSAARSPPAPADSRYESRMRAVVLLTLLIGCMPPIARPADNAIDLRYRLPAAHSTASDVYQAIGSKSLAVQSRCKMVPTDSEMFGVRARDCGGMRAWYWGI